MTDTLFSGSDNLKWIPWVGEQYFNIAPEKRILIVGESHYHDGSSDSMNSSQKTEFTRVVINELAISGNNGKTKMFQNTHKALFANDTFDRAAFWNLVSFYNFIQEPMNTITSRPTTAMYTEGWNVFAEVVSILKPKTCLFLGNTAANYLETAMKNKSSIKVGDIRWDKRIGRAYAKEVKIWDVDQHEVTLLFIKHPSSYFNWMNWNTYLNGKLKSELEWLRSELKL